MRPAPAVVAITRRRGAGASTGNQAFRRAALRALALAIGIAASACSPSFQRETDAPHERWIGCYALDRGPWNRPHGPGRFLEPGGSLRISGERALEQLINSGPPTPVRVWRADLPDAAREAVWWVDGGGRLVVHTQGFAGVVAVLAPVSADALKGTVKSFTDVLRPDSARRMRRITYHAPITALRVPCHTLPAKSVGAPLPMWE